jgi:hypothetical protein
MPLALSRVPRSSVTKKNISSARFLLPRNVEVANRASTPASVFVPEPLGSPWVRVPPIHD